MTDNTYLPNWRRWHEASFSSELIPVIPPHSKLSETSKLDANDLGKTPGMRKPDGTWIGFFGRWKDFLHPDEDTLREWASWQASVGMQGRRHPGIDIDVEDRGFVDCIQGCALDVLGAAPIRFRDGSPRVLLPYRAAAGFVPKKQRLVFRINGEDHAVELLACGQQYLVDGVHKSGAIYQWREDNGYQHPCDMGPAGLTEITEQQVERFFDQVEEIVQLLGGEITDRSRGSNGERDENAGLRVADEDEWTIQRCEHYIAYGAPEVSEGRRDNTAVAVANRLYDWAATEATVVDMLSRWNEEKVFPPLSDDDIKRIAASALCSRLTAIGCKHWSKMYSGFYFVDIEEPANDNASGGSDKNWPEPVNLWPDEEAPPELPEGVVPEIIERWARDRGRRLGVEAGAPAAALVTALGSLVPAGNVLQMRQRDTEWEARAILWMMLVADSASNKSATLGAAMAPIFALEKRWQAKYADAMRAYDAAVEQSKQKKKSKDESADDKAPPEEPTLRQKIIMDVTTEAVIEVMAANSDGLLFFADELASLFGGMDAYRNKGNKDRPFWLGAKDGRFPHTVNRKGKAPITAPRVACSVIGGIQPDKIREMCLDLGADGMLQRFMPVNLLRLGRGEDIYPMPKLYATIDKLAYDLAEWSPRDRGFKFEPAAADELTAVEDFVDAEAARPNVPKSMVEWLKKLPQEFGRLALAFHFMEWYAGEEAAKVVRTSDTAFTGDSLPELVSRATAQRASRFLIEFIIPHARAFHASMSSSRQTETHADWIAKYILTRKLEQISDREIQRAYGAVRGRDHERDRQNAMNELELSDWVRAFGTTKWKVNPLVHDGRFSRIAEAERERRESAQAGIKARASERRRRA
jgi:uncharacterized protein DUF3987/primase-like protein